MKSYTLNKFGSQLNIWEYLPTEGIPVLMQQDTRQPLENFHNKWFEDRGYELIEVSNCSLFGYTKNGKATSESIPYGTTMNDKGHWINRPYINDGLITMVYQNNEFIVDDFVDINKYPNALIMFGGFPCILNGYKDNRKWDKTAHLSRKTDRTIIGQKFDGTIIKVIADRLTANECSAVCKELKVKNAVIVDGGGSVQQLIKGKHINLNRRDVANVLGTYALKPQIETVEKEDDIMKYAVVNVDNGNVKILDGSHKLSKNFSISELACNDGSEVILYSGKLIELVQAIRDIVGPLTISSFFRTPAYNKKVNGVGDSRHLFGTAIDMTLPEGYNTDSFYKVVEKVVGTQCAIGKYKTFIHLDIGRVARW